MPYKHFFPLFYSTSKTMAQISHTIAVNVTSTNFSQTVPTVMHKAMRITGFSYHSVASSTTDIGYIVRCNGPYKGDLFSFMLPATGSSVYDDRDVLLAISPGTAQTFSFTLKAIGASADSSISGYLTIDCLFYE